MSHTKTGPDGDKEKKEKVAERCRQHRGYEPRCRFCVAYLDAINVDPPPSATFGYDEDDDQPRDWGDL